MTAPDLPSDVGYKPTREEGDSDGDPSWNVCRHVPVVIGISFIFLGTTFRLLTTHFGGFAHSSLIHEWRCLGIVEFKNMFSAFPNQIVPFHGLQAGMEESDGAMK